MTSRTDYFRCALSRAEGNRDLLSKVSAIPLSNNRNRTSIIHSAKEMQSVIQLNLAKLAITKPKSWKTHVAAIDRDFTMLEDTLEKLWTKPLSCHNLDSFHVDHTSGN